MFHKLWSFLDAFWDGIVFVFHFILDAIVYIIGTIVYYIYAALLATIEVFINSIDTATLSFFDDTNPWSELPVQVIYILNILDFPTLLTMLAASYLIRFLLNLIPSWATRA